MMRIKKLIIQMKDGTPFLVISQIAQDTSMKPAEAQDIKKKIQTEKTVEKTTEGTRVQGASTKRFAVINDTWIDVYDGEKKEPFFTIPAMGQMNHWWHFLKKMNSWWYTATEKLRSGILLPEKDQPHRWWIWILHRKQIFWQIRKADIWRCIQERAR